MQTDPDAKSRALPIALIYTKRHSLQMFRVVTIFIVGLYQMTTAGAAEPTADMRETARVFVVIERPLEQRDHKGYCRAAYGQPDYAEAVARTCKIGLKEGIGEPRDCTKIGVRETIKSDLDRCHAMTASEFSQERLRFRDQRKQFVEWLAGQGVDGERLLVEARAKQGKLH